MPLTRRAAAQHPSAAELTVATTLHVPPRSAGAAHDLASLAMASMA